MFTLATILCASWLLMKLFHLVKAIPHEDGAPSHANSTAQHALIAIALFLLVFGLFATILRIVRRLGFTAQLRQNNTAENRTELRPIRRPQRTRAIPELFPTVQSPDNPFAQNPEDNIPQLPLYDPNPIPPYSSNHSSKENVCPLGVVPSVRPRDGIDALAEGSRSAQAISRAAAAAVPIVLQQLHDETGGEVIASPPPFQPSRVENPDHHGLVAVTSQVAGVVVEHACIRRENIASHVPLAATHQADAVSELHDATGS